MAIRNPEWDQQNTPIQKLFNTVNEGPGRNVIGKGDIVVFGYVSQQRNYQIHDPTPLVIVSDIFTDMIRGVNLHYLTLPYVKSLVMAHANNPNFSFRFISGDAYIVGAFRSYKRNGISQLKMLDANFLKNLLSVVRALDPGEIEQMREQVRQMIEQQMRQPSAEPGLEQI